MWYVSSHNRIMSTCYAHFDKHTLYNKLLRQIQLTKINFSRNIGIQNILGLKVKT